MCEAPNCVPDTKFEIENNVTALAHRWRSRESANGEKRRYAGFFSIPSRTLTREALIKFPWKWRTSKEWEYLQNPSRPARRIRMSRSRFKVDTARYKFPNREQNRGVYQRQKKIKMESKILVPTNRFLSSFGHAG